MPGTTLLALVVWRDRWDTPRGRKVGSTIGLVALPCLVVMALTLAVFLWPGTAAKLAPLTKDWPVAGPLTILAGTAMAVLVLSHARRVPLWVLVERLALAVGLGIACIIIFVDGLGLALKSAYVIDGWNVVKSVVFRPLISIFR